MTPTVCDWVIHKTGFPVRSSYFNIDCQRSDQQCGVLRTLPALGRLKSWGRGVQVSAASRMKADGHPSRYYIHLGQTSLLFNVFCLHVLGRIVHTIALAAK